MRQATSIAVDRLARSAATLAVAIVTMGFGAAAASAAPRPVFGRSVVVARTGGVVLVRLRGTRRAVILKGRRAIPLGSTVDASHGRVVVAGAIQGSTELQSGTAYGGEFVVEQEHSGTVDLRLVAAPSKRSACAVHSSVLAFEARRVPYVSIVHIRTTPPGRFEGSGEYGHGTSPAGMRRAAFRIARARASEAAEQTEWTTVDYCHRTAISDQRGEVATEGGATVQARVLAPGQTVQYQCSTGGEGVTTGYCVELFAVEVPPASGSGPPYINLQTQLGARVELFDEAELCLDGPSEAPSCARYPLSPQGNGLSAANVNCTPNEGLGEYSFAWSLAGTTLSEPLVYIETRPTAHVPQCSVAAGVWNFESLAAPLPANYKFASRIHLPTAGEAYKLAVRLVPSGAPGQEVVQGVVYRDENDAPGAFIASTEAITVSAASNSDIAYDLPFARWQDLAPGYYWIGIITGGDGNVADYAYDALPPLDGRPPLGAHARAFNANSYAAGPSNPFGASIDDDDLMQMQMLYFPVRPTF